MPSSPTAPMTACATMPCAPRRCSAVERTASISMKPGTAMRASIRCTRTASPCAAIRRRTQGADRLRDALDAQAARGPVAVVLHPRPRRPRRDRSRSLQRSLHDADDHLAALCDHRFQRHRLRDDGRPGGHSLTQEVIEEAIDFRQAWAAAGREFADKKDWFFKPWNAEKVKIQGGGKAPPSTMPGRAARHRPRTRGCCTRATNGTASTASPTAGACSTRSRSASSARAWAMTASWRRPASRRPWSRLFQPLRHRSLAHHRLHGDVPVLDRHHQGQVGHADEQSAGLQA